MVQDNLWNYPQEAETVLTEIGYSDPYTGDFVPLSAAFEYALDHCLHGALEEQEEFKKMLEEWFYSGWVKEE